MSIFEIFRRSGGPSAEEQEGRAAELVAAGYEVLPLETLIHGWAQMDPKTPTNLETLSLAVPMLNSNGQEFPSGNVINKAVGNMIEVFGLGRFDLIIVDGEAFLRHDGPREENSFFG